MRSWMKRLNPFWLIVLAFFTCAAAAHLKYETSSEKGARKAMKSYYIGRFCIKVPALLEQKIRSSKVRYTEIQEMEWLRSTSSEKARTVEWERFMVDVKKLSQPKGTEKVILKRYDSSANGNWARGIFYYNDRFDGEAAQWAVLMDAGQIGVWVVGEPSIVEKEISDPKMLPNIQRLTKSYQPLDLTTLKGQQSDNRFYLRHGAINLPYSEQEESIARFEGHPLKLTLLIEMYMDFTKEIENISLINGTRAMLAAALVTPGGSMSKIRLRKREVAGMPGEEAVLRVREGDSKDLVFTWQFNGKDDSGEYPTTRIEMESPDGNLSEKLEIWDAILDSMQPMFERKKS